jgi:hypothetical protein
MVAEGDCYVVECAVRADGVTSPAAAFLDHLAAGTWIEDPDLTEVPDDAQISHYDKFLTFCKVLADEGEPYYARAVNYLRDGVWEFKLGAKRLTFFDTPGDGTYIPKAKPATREEASRGEYYWFPDFDEFVRLGHAFPKIGEQAEESDLVESARVREEDISHDRAE